MTATRRSAPGADPRQKLVVFAPYPPARSGIADYAAELMPFHLAEFDVTLVIADDAPVPVDAGPRVLLASEFRKYRSAFESASKLYHIGNNPHHGYMLDFLGRDRGVVILHDYNLTYMHEEATLKWGNERPLLSAMEREYGALGRDILSWQMQNEYRELFAGYELPLNGDVLERASAIVTHSRQVQYRVAARVPEKPVWYVPHHLSPRAADYLTLSKRDARNQLGLPQDEIVVTAVGFVTRAKQIPMALSALAALRGRTGAFRFVLAGERRPDEYDVDADIAKSGLEAEVICTDYLDEESFFRHLVAADIIVNLRYPSGGEMSGTLVRALGLGVPTIVLDHGPMGELPETAVKKITWDDHTQNALTDALFELMTDEKARLELGVRGAHYARTEHDIVTVAAKYNRILRETTSGAAPESVNERTRLRLHFPHPSAVARRFRAYGDERQHAIPQSDGRMWWTTGATPLGDERRRALVVSAKPHETAELLHALFDWKESDITALTPEAFIDLRIADKNGAAIAAGHFTLALAIVPADMEEASAELLLRRLNRSLCLGGCLCVETRGSADAEENPRALLGREQLTQRVRDAGFGNVREWSRAEGLIAALLARLPEESEAERRACTTAQKISNYAVWRYADSPAGLPMRLGGRLAAARGE